jgi:aryl-alcohol dehydrogenase-like predicted oxidoreductase
MKYRTLGRTGLNVSIMGLGTGGGSDPLGQESGIPEAEIHKLIHHAFDRGINYFDTSPGYMESEVILGRALKQLDRDSYVVSTKVPLAGGHSDNVMVMKPSEVRETVERSLRRLGMDYVDVLLMAVAHPRYFEPVMNDHLPVLEALKQEGKIRFLGSSEQTRSDGSHQWLQAIIPTDVLDVAMAGHNMINQSAQRTVFPLCREKNMGVVNVFTVRNLFWNQQRLSEVIADLKQRGKIDTDQISTEKPLNWIVEEGAANTLVEAAYRFAGYTDPVTVVMCGSKQIPELDENIDSINKGPLPREVVEKLRDQFGNIDEPIGN